MAQTECINEWGGCCGLEHRRKHPLEAFLLGECIFETMLWMDCAFPTFFFSPLEPRGRLEPQRRGWMRAACRMFSDWWITFYSRVQFLIHVQNFFSLTAEARYNWSNRQLLLSVSLFNSTKHNGEPPRSWSNLWFAELDFTALWIQVRHDLPRKY